MSSLPFSIFWQQRKIQRDILEESNVFLEAIVLILDYNQVNWHSSFVSSQKQCPISSITSQSNYQQYLYVCSEAMQSDIFFSKITSQESSTLPPLVDSHIYAVLTCQQSCTLYSLVNSYLRCLGMSIVISVACQQSTIMSSHANSHPHGFHLSIVIYLVVACHQLPMLYLLVNTPLRCIRFSTVICLIFVL